MNYQLLPGETCQLTIQASSYYSADTLQVETGEHYLFSCKKSERWTDWFIPASAEGYWNPLAIFAGMRIPGVPCFKLCGIYDQDDQTVIVIGSRKELQADRTGAITFFANDAKDPKYYKNNKGAVKLDIQRTA